MLIRQLHFVYIASHQRFNYSALPLVLNITLEKLKHQQQEHHIVSYQKFNHGALPLILNITLEKLKHQQQEHHIITHFRHSIKIMIITIVTRK